MAKTYVGYVKREVANEIDWASIGSGISDMLLEEKNAREAKKKAIDDASREFAKVLTDAEGSEHTGINQFFLDGANSIQEVRLMQDRLLRSGQLRLKDYNIQRQNAIDGTNELLALVKGYDTKYKEKMERLQAGVSAAQEQYQMEQIEGFSNFQNHRLYVNPTNGQFSIGKTVPGKGGINELSKDPNDFSTMQALRNRLNIKIDRYDWDKNLQQGVDNLAKIVLAKNVGGVKTAEDARQSKEYKNAKNNWIDSMMTSSVNVGSMLTDWIGGYTFTQDAFEAGQDDSKILLVPDPRQPSSGNLVPKLSDAQDKVVKDRLEQEFESRVDRIETAMPVQTLSARERQLRGQAESAIDNIAKLWYGTTQEIESAASFLEGVLPSVSGIDVKENEVTVTKIDIDGTVTGKKGKRYTKPYPREEFNTFIESISGELGGAVSASQAVQIATSKLPEGRTAKGGTGSFLVEKPMGLTEKFGNYIETYLTETLPLSKDEEEAQSQLEGLLKPFGNFEIEQFGFGDNIKITYPTGKTTAPLELEVDLSDADAVQQIKNFLINNISFFEEGVAIQESNINESLSGATGGAAKFNKR